MKDYKPDYVKLAGAVIAAIYLFSCAASPTFGHLIDNLDLVIHEAGHVFMMPFGDFIHVLGGSLFQVMIPAIFSGYFFFRREWFSASMILMWVGYNLVNVSAYIGDSVTMQLPLLGGDNVIHDWNYLLSVSHTLVHTHLFAQIAWGIGMTIMLAGFGSCIRFSFRDRV
jgi:hypothetical protein